MCTSYLSFLLPRGRGLDSERLVLPPPHRDGAVPCDQRVAGDGFPVLVDSNQRLAGLELDDVPGHRPEVDDIDHPTRFRVATIHWARRRLCQHDLLGPDRESPPVTVEQVRDTNETRNERVG